jgi:hypothetical protein
MLASIPIANCWMDNETAGRYEWALNCFRSIVWPKDLLDNSEVPLQLPKCFVTDKDMALKGALKTVFPESNQILCYSHIKKNFMLKFRSVLTKEMKSSMFKWTQAVKKSCILNH